MSSAPFACPHCRGAMSLPSHLAGMTVACPHCKQPFQVPTAAGLDEPALDPSLFAAPRARPSLEKGPGMRGWMWIALGTVAAGMLLAVVLILRPTSSLKADLKRDLIRQEYDRINQGMPAEQAVKIGRVLMQQFPGELSYTTSDEDGMAHHVFQKGDYKLIIRVSPITGQVAAPPSKEGF